MEYHIKYGSEIIEYEVRRKNVKNINLNVQPDMRVIISASNEVPLDYINKFVSNKAPWIIKQQKYFNRVQPDSLLKKEYVSGESFKYLGRQYRLKVRETYGVEGVKLYQGYFYLFIRDKNNNEKKKKLLNEWFRLKAISIFSESLDRVYPLVAKYGVIKPKVSIRTMKARWGSCLYKAETILLNFDLIISPKYCIDYVVLHEIIHFIHRAHNKDFYNLLTVLMPDWKHRKEILDEEVVREL